MAFQKKQNVDATGDFQTKTAKDIAMSYDKLSGDIGTSEKVLNDLKLLVKVQSESVAASEQERSRSHEAAMYQLAQERQTVVDRYARDDAEREAIHHARNVALTTAEVDLCTLLSITRTDDGHMQVGKAIELAFNTKIAATDKAAEGRGRGMAQAEYAMQKKIDTAEANTASALLKQENDQLKRENAALVARNGELSSSQQKTVDKIAEVAAGAFSAAGGVVAKGNDALGTAAGAGGSGPLRGR